MNNETGFEDHAFKEDESRSIGFIVQCSRPNYTKTTTHSSLIVRLSFPERFLHHYLVVGAAAANTAAATAA